MSKCEGLIKKYQVERMDGKPMPEGCIVLEWKDPNARVGIAAFSRRVRRCGYEKLADDLDSKLDYFGYVRPAKDKP